jgi:hypothetical protein
MMREDLDEVELQLLVLIANVPYDDAVRGRLVRPPTYYCLSAAVWKILTPVIIKSTVHAFLSIVVEDCLCRPHVPINRSVLSGGRKLNTKYRKVFMM